MFAEVNENNWIELNSIETIRVKNHVEKFVIEFGMHNGFIIHSKDFNTREQAVNYVRSTIFMKEYPWNK